MCWGAEYWRGIVPISMFSPEAVSDLTMGKEHGCAIVALAPADPLRIHCWGSNQYGQLGDYTFEDHVDPMPVGVDLDAAELAAGDEHTCAITSAGAVYCWGSNDDGECGTSLSYAILAPNLVEGL